jgi:Restriction endonuclease fold toxin 5
MWGAGAILLIVIAIAVTAVVAPWATAIIAGKAAVAAGTISVLASATGLAVGAAAGSIVSQAVGVATGIQDKFSWKAVGLSALTAFLGPVSVGKIAGSAFLGNVVGGALTSAVVQGAAVATGLQSKFDWAGVAVAGITAGVGGAIGGAFGKPASTLAAIGQRVVTGAAAAIAGAGARSLATGTEFGDNVIAALPDVVAQTLGNAVADTLAAKGAPRVSKDAGKKTGGSSNSKSVNRDITVNADAIKFNRPTLLPDMTTSTQAKAMVQVVSGGGGTPKPKPAPDTAPPGPTADDIPEIVVTGRRMSEAERRSYDRANPLVIGNGLFKGYTSTNITSGPPRAQMMLREDGRYQYGYNEVVSFADQKARFVSVSASDEVGAFLMKAGKELVALGGEVVGGVGDALSGMAQLGGDMLVSGAYDQFKLGSLFGYGTSAPRIVQNADRRNAATADAIVTGQVFKNAMYGYAGAWDAVVLNNDLRPAARGLGGFITGAGASKFTILAGRAGRVVTGAAESALPGAWRTVNESMSARSLAYQTQVTGRSGEAFVANGVRFDGFEAGAFLEAKGPGYATFVKNGEFRSWFRGQDGLLDQAFRQSRAANGAPVTWHVAESKAADAMRTLFATDRRIQGITVVHTPVGR